MAVAVVERVKQDSMYGLSAARDKKSVRCRQLVVVET